MRYHGLMNDVPVGDEDPCHRDGLHMNRAGHAHVAGCLGPLVQQLALQARDGRYDRDMGPDHEKENGPLLGP
jgi:hypothetical protein